MKSSVETLRKKNLRLAMHLRRKMRVRKKVSGDLERPRLSVFRSAKHIYAQVINDVSGTTVASASTLDKELSSKLSGIKKSEAAVLVGDLVSRRLKEKGVETVVFDRNGYRYKGRIAALAHGAREAGLKF